MSINFSPGEITGFIWSICNLLRGPYKRNEYRKVILPLTVLRRFDSILESTKTETLKAHAAVKGKGDNIVHSRLSEITGVPFYNLSKLTFATPPKGSPFHGLLDDPNQLASNLNGYINGFSKNVRTIMERFGFATQIERMAEKDLLFLVIKKFAEIDLSPQRVDNHSMGMVFEELIRIGAEQANEEAGEHFTPREVITLMVNLLLSPEKDLARSHVVKTIYDPACGTGGMLSVAEQYIRQLNKKARPALYGQDWNDEAWAVCKSDMLIKGEEADNIILGDTFLKDGFDRRSDSSKYTFDYMLANPPFGVEWKQQQKYIEQERDSLAFNGRFGAGTPRVNDGAMLFLQHMIAKMRPKKEGGSRIGIVFNGSPLFTGDAESGESEIRRWIIENDWLEAIIALPEQLFYNTGISTYIWILTNRKEKERQGKVQMIDARQYWVPMEKSLGNKRRRIGQPTTDKPKDPNHIGEITTIVGNLKNNESRLFQEEDSITHQPVKKKRIVCKIFNNRDLGYAKITVERPLRLNFRVDAERLARLEEENGFKNLAVSKKKSRKEHDREVQEGIARQSTIRELLASFGKSMKGKTYKNREVFLDELRAFLDGRRERFVAAELKAILSAIGERDSEAEICRNNCGDPEADSELRDTETVSLEKLPETVKLNEVKDSPELKKLIAKYVKEEVLPHVPDAWIDEAKTKIGYEIPLNRHFYRYEPPRELETIEREIKDLETEIVLMLKEVTA